jgi:hypothetical protein
MALAAVASLGGMCANAAAQETAEQKYVVSIERIWDRAAHSAFTDLIALGEHLYCAFREGSGHIPGLNGVIRVIRSRDGSNWESVARLDEEHFDLRDPKLALTPDGRLIVNMGASRYHGSKRLGIESRVAFAASNGGSFGPPQKVQFPREMVTGGDWLWRVTWHKGVAWGCVQQVFDGKRALQLVRSDDAIHFTPVTALDVEGANETTLRFLPDDTMVAMIRSEAKPPSGSLGIARPPYTEWKFLRTNKRFGGPNFIRLPGGTWLAGSRDYDPSPRTALWRLDLDSGAFQDLLTLPSGGDTSYPGFVVDEKNQRLYVSFYSTHEGKTAIYLATLRLDVLEQESKTESSGKQTESPGKAGG